MKQRNHVKACLMLKGYNSIEQWARSQGYNPVTVRQVINRYINSDTGKVPVGVLTRKILSDVNIIINAIEQKFLH